MLQEGAGNSICGCRWLQLRPRCLCAMGPGDQAEVLAFSASVTTQEREQGFSANLAGGQTDPSFCQNICAILPAHRKQRRRKRFTIQNNRGRKNLRETPLRSAGSGRKCQNGEGGRCFLTVQIMQMLSLLGSCSLLQGTQLGDSAPRSQEPLCKTQSRSLFLGSRFVLS